MGYIYNILLSFFLEYACIGKHPFPTNEKKPGKIMVDSGTSPDTDIYDPFNPRTVLNREHCPVMSDRWADTTDLSRDCDVATSVTNFVEEITVSSLHLQAGDLLSERIDQSDAGGGGLRVDVDSDVFYDALS